jgi:hypothetical protein
MSGSAFITGSLTVSNTITAQTLVVQTVSSSVVFSSGSNIFGNSLANTHQFTGSVTITGSLSVNNSSVILSNQTGSMSVLTSSHALTGSNPFIIGNTQFNNSSSVTAAGTTIVSAIPTGSYTAAFYRYTLASASNARAGEVMSVWSGSTVRYTEVTTTDIGNTSLVYMSVGLSNGNVVLNASSSGGWTIKAIANLL